MKTETETEHVIQSTLRELTAGRTTFIIAHRLSTVMEGNLPDFLEGKKRGPFKIFWLNQELS